MATADPVIVDFLVRGVPNVQKAFRTVRDMCTQAERALTTEVERGARARIRATENEARARRAALTAATKTSSTGEKAATREFEAESRKRTRLAQREAEAKIAAAKAYQREADKIGGRGAGGLGALGGGAGGPGRRPSPPTDGPGQGFLNYKFSQAVVGAGARGFQQGLGNFANAGKAIVGQLLQAGGGFSVADAVSQELRIGKEATQLVVGTDRTLAENKGITSEKVAGKAKALASYLAEDPEEMVKGLSKFKDLSGNLGKAMDLSEGIGKISVATGTGFADAMGIAGNIVAGDTEKKLSNEQVLDSIAVLAAQGQKGAVEVKDMARYSSRLLAGTAYMSGNDTAEGRTRNLATMGSFAQIARQSGGASSAAEATMAASQFMDDVAKKADKLNALGIRVSDNKGAIKDPVEIIKEMLKFTGGDVTKIKDTALGQRGKKVLLGSSNIYKQAGGGEAGLAAVDKWMREMINTAPDKKQIDAAHKEKISTPAAQFELAVQRLRSVVGEALVPAFLRLLPILEKSIPTIQKFMDMFVSLVEWAAANPWKAIFGGLGASITASMTQSIAAAAMGEALKNMLTQSISSPAKGFELNMASATAALGITVASLGAIAQGVAAIDAYFSMKAKEYGASAANRGNVLSEAGKFITDASSGAMSEEDIQKGRELQSKLRNEEARAKIERKGPQYKFLPTSVKDVEANVDLAASLVSTDAKQNIERKKQQALQDEGTLGATLDRLTAALNKAAENADANRKTPLADRGVTK